MSRILCRFALGFALIGFCNPLSAQDKRFNGQFTFRNLKISAAAGDSKDKYLTLAFAEGKLMFFTIHSDKFRWFTPWTGHDKKAITSVAFCPDNSIFASAAMDGNVKFWDYDSAAKFAEETEKLQEKEARKVPPPTMTKLIKAHSAGSVSIAFSPDSKKLATAGADGLIKIWSLADTKKPIATMLAHKGGVHCLAFSFDGGLLASGGADKTAKLWRISVEIMEERNLGEHEGPVLAVAFSRDGKQIATGSGAPKKPGQLRVWDAATGKESFSLAGHEDVVTSVNFHPKEPRLVSCSKDKTLRVWDLEMKKELYKDLHVDGLIQVFWINDGKLIGSFSPQEGKWWLGMPRLN